MMDTGGVQPGYVVCVILLCLCLSKDASALNAGQNHVQTHVYYTKESYTDWLVITFYRSVRKEYYTCESGWESNNNIACDYAICNGKTNLNGACNDYYPNSHIIYTGGNVQNNADGSCSNPDSCTCTKTGFYSSYGSCGMCTAINNCNIETCTNSADQTCQVCEGVVQERAGFRAYVVSSDRRACNQACSWRSDSTRCYPGSCSTEVTSSCACSAGFTGDQCNTITAQPDIIFNELKLTSSDGTQHLAPLDPNAGPGTSQLVWTNIVGPASIYYKFDAQYKPSLPSPQAYVNDVKIGVTGGTVAMTARDSAGASRGTFYTACTGNSRDSPNQAVYSCQATLQQAQFGTLPLLYQHGERLDFTFTADNGGYVMIDNKETGAVETHYYTGSTQTHSFQVKFDTVLPYHCQVSSGCATSMLTVTDITKSPSQTISWDGWLDDTSGLAKYQYHVYELHEVGGQLRHKSITTSGTVDDGATSGSTTFSVSQAGMYAVVLSAHDRATNYKSARRLFLYDATSAVTATSAVLRVTSAAEVASWKWQQTQGDVTVTWAQRYTNTFHDSNHLLAAVTAEAGVETAYDDGDGTRTTSAIDNTLGIVKFTTAYRVDSAGGTTLTVPADTSFSAEPDLSSIKVMRAGVMDGQSLTLWVRAYDIRDDYLQEQVTVHVDSSPPIITNLWLTKDHIVNVSVHGLEQLNEMTIEWVAYDDHSGLETVKWRLLDLFSGNEIIHGVENVPAQGQAQTLTGCQTTYGSYARGPNCYCTGAAGCYHRHFQVKPTVIDGTSQSHGGIFNHANTGVHDFDYHLEVTVMNHAKLSTTIRKQITLDASPPHTGVVHDGMPGSPEVDYQSSTTLHAHWSDFFDRESGIKFYQYAFHTACLGATFFGHVTTDTRVSLTYGTTATWEAPSDGKYFVTVVAFNSAIEPSAPVCSDGVTVDVSPPELSGVYVEGANVAPGLVRREGTNEVWFVDADRRRRLVNTSDLACLAKASSGMNLEAFALKPVTSPLPASEACHHGPFLAKFQNAFYLGRHHYLYLNWTGRDAQSGIYDYEVGMATDAGNNEAPDISGYTSTNHHSFYSAYHSALPEDSPFYIQIRATNKADVSSVTTLGPVVLTRQPASYTGSVTLSLSAETLLVSWDTSLLTDVEPEHLTFSVALEEQTGGSALHPHVTPQFSGSCSASVPLSCATFNLSALHWGLHEKHVYLAKVKVTNIVGLDLQLTSDPYVHDTRLAAGGTVYDVVPVEEVEMLDVQRSEDSDFQLSRTVYEARWSGFEDGTQGVTYRVGVGSAVSRDDVVTFLPVGTATSHKFISLNLQLNTKYFFTVVAVTSGGEVTVSSDGMTVIQAGQTTEGVVVLDGPVCPQTSANDSWTPEHHTEMLPLPCESDLDYQLSLDTLVARWSLTTQQRMRYPDVQWKVQKAIPGVDVWLDVKNYRPSRRTDMITASGLALQPGSRYRFAVRLCVGRTCNQALYSDGVTVLSGPPKTRRMAVAYADGSGGGASLTVTFETFKDPDVADLTTAKLVMAGYQWTLVDISQGQKLLQAWKTVQGLQTVNNTHSRFTVTIPSGLSFTECLGVSLRGMNKVRLVTEATAEVKDCKAKDPVLVVARLVLDAVGSTVAGTISSGSPVTLGFNDGWSRGDLDYTPHTNIISAVWPTLRHSQVTWAVIATQGEDVTSHFTNTGPQATADPCSSLDSIACGQVEGQKYVNVNFGPAHSRPLLENGRHYYVCVHADAETVTFEKWTGQLPEVSACSDGVTVDTTAPKAGQVVVDGLRGGVYQTSLTVVSARWSGFSDIEEIRATAHHSGIMRYLIAVGSVPLGEDVLKFKDVGLSNHVTLHALTLQDGHTYYVTVKAEDHAGRSVADIADGFVADSSAPARTAFQFRLAQDYITSASSFSVCWKDMFVDKESGLDGYIVSLGSRPGHDDVMLGQSVTSECDEFITDVTLVNGHAYYVNVKAVNGAGLQSSATSPAITVMMRSPSRGHVFDGHPPVTGSSHDVDFVNSSVDVAAFWTGFSTPLSPVTSYSVRLGRCAGCGDVMDDFDAGLTEEVGWSHLSLREGVRYYTTVTACNAVDQCVEVRSDGVMIDVTPPITGEVWDGTGDADINFQAQRDYLGVQWRGFTDLGSGLAGFSWRAGTSPGGSDVMGSRDAGLAMSAFTSTLPAQLPAGQTIFITVTARDRAGNSVEVSSNGLRIDTSPPAVLQTPVLSRGLGTLDNDTLVSRDVLAVRWELQDSVSAVETHFVSLGSHQLGEFDASPVQVPGPLKEYAFTGLSLHDGSRYSAKVTGCNLARLCTTTVLADVLHDSTPPTTGMFAVDTDHAADLRRQVDGWMGWTSTQLTLAWLGFQDLHSGIDHYLVSVGSTPFASDLTSGGSQAKVSHSESGTSYEDEGFVQTFEVPTLTLSAGGSVYVAVWAVNGVGLRSHPVLSQFDLEVGGGLSLRRRCTAYSCLSQCVCAVQGGVCGAPTSCTVHATGSNPNTILTVYDRADLRTVELAPLSSDGYFASTVYLAATWTPTITQNLQPARYEVSVGRSNANTPSGVFNAVTDRVWKDVGRSTHSVIVLPPGLALAPKVSYSTFVRCWYTDGSYSIFKSPGIIPLVNAAATTNQLGKAVKEHMTSNQEKDVDFVTSSDAVHVTWRGKFINTSSPIERFNVVIGTQLEAHDVHSSPDLTPTTETYQATGLSLQENTLYYTTVLAWGKGALVAWAMSDGFILDTTVPVSGVVVDGTGLQDANYQSPDHHLSATWHGFSDTGSGVRRYHWCVGVTSNTSECDAMKWTDVGLMTSASADLDASVAAGTVLYNKVWAEDAAGHGSEVSVSNGVKVDTTPPEVKDVVYSDGVNLLSNPSFEVDAAGSMENQTICDDQPPAAWQITPGSCVIVHRPLHTVSYDGSQHLLLSGTLTQALNGLTPGAVYRLTVRLGYPDTPLSHHLPLTGHVTLGKERHGFELDPAMCRGVCNDVGHEPVIMWHEYSYITTPSAPTLDVSITTTVASGEQQLAVDHVDFQEVHYAERTGAESGPALSSGAVFLPEWSVVQASWHFADAESSIVEYQWALGTVPGGVQIQPFRSVGRRQHASVSGVKLTHQLPIYITVLARNAAGLTSLAHSQPLVTDLTPPVISDLMDGAGSDVDFQTSTVVSATWTARDSESKVAYCQWAVGFTSGKGDVLAFENVPPPTSDTYTASADVASALSDVMLPQTLHVTVRCYNKAGLPARGVTDGVTIVAGDSQNSVSTLRLPPESLTQYPALETCHVMQDRLRVRWDNVASTIPVAAFKVGFTSNGIGATETTPPLPYLLESAILKGLNFASDTVYGIVLSPVDIENDLGANVNKSVHLKPNAPTVKAQGSLTSSVSGTDLTISWPGLFISDIDLVYEVTVGTVLGSSDLLLWRETKDTSVAVSLERAKAKTFPLKVIVTAIDPCGQFVSYTGPVVVNL